MPDEPRRRVNLERDVALLVRRPLDVERRAGVVARRVHVRLGHDQRQGPVRSDFVAVVAPGGARGGREAGVGRGTGQLERETEVKVKGREIKSKCGHPLLV